MTVARLSLFNTVVERLEELRSDPFPRQTAKMSGAEGLYRLRIGDYRVIYEVDTSEKRVMVHYVRHRREVYRGL